MQNFSEVVILTLMALKCHLQAGTLAPSARQAQVLITMSHGKSLGYDKKCEIPKAKILIFCGIAHP